MCVWGCVGGVGVCAGVGVCVGVGGGGGCVCGVGVYVGLCVCVCVYGCVWVCVGVWGWVCLCLAVLGENSVWSLLHQICLTGMYVITSLHSCVGCVDSEQTTNCGLSPTPRDRLSCDGELSPS